MISLFNFFKSFEVSIQPALEKIVHILCKFCHSMEKNQPQIYEISDIIFH